MASVFKSSYSIVNLPRDRGDTEQIEEMLQAGLTFLIITFKWVKSSMEHKVPLNSSESQCKFGTICSIRIFNILKDIKGVICAWADTYKSIYGR